MSQQQKDQVITISTRTIIKILVVLFALWIAWITRQIILIIFVSLIFAALIDPFADWFQRKKIPRGLAVIAIYIVIITLLVVTLLVLVPPIVGETTELIRNFGTIWQRGVDKLGVVGDLARQYNLMPSEGFAGTIQPAASKTVEGIFSTIGGFFTGLASILLVAALTFYMVVEEDAIKKMLRHVAPDEYQPFLSRLFSRIREKLGLWLRGQLVLSITVGLLYYIGLTILGVDYAAVLGLLAGVMELVPYIGPLIVGVIAIFLTFTQSGTLLQPLLVLGLLAVIQWCENNLLVPKIMQKAVGLNPIISIVALLVGARLAGIVGAILAIPVATALSVFVYEMTNKDSKEV
ncbi:MAG TPA: hypothetical protein DDW36_03295 [Candidatus Magasanikbacteria bacterium]|nr:hypothetical protein [Candidatus Magasanikbacteria bacterium]